MKTRLLMLLPVLACVAAQTYSPSPEEKLKMGTAVIASATNEYRGTNYLAELNWAEIRDSPAWDGDEKPPLSTSKAESVAGVYLEKRLGRPGTINLIQSSAQSGDSLPPWMPLEVAIHRFYGSKLWFYEVKLQPLIGGSYNWPSITVFVSMSGQVAPLRVLN
jgi:hypothetical protein